MNTRIVTYSLLAHINNSVVSKSNFYQIFVPLVKRALSKMCTEGKYKGDDTAEIIATIQTLFGIDMPMSILKVLLLQIDKEVNTEERQALQIFKDGSFIISRYIFDDYEEEIDKRTKELNSLEEVFDEFAKIEELEIPAQSVFDFIEQTKVSLGKYIGKKYPQNYRDNTLEARFVNFVSNIPQLYDVLQAVYIGSIIATYLEYQPSIQRSQVELVFDTNFIISLMDLNTPNSTHNCRKLLEIAEKLGYRFTVLDITIKEVDGLLKKRIDNFDSAFLSKLLDPEDIYNACERRNLSKTDLDKIRDDISEELTKYKVVIVPNTTKYENKAKFSETYEQLKGKRNTNFAALHDATCIEYVKEKRGKNQYEFDRVNCWFINNSSSRGGFSSNGIQPYHIKAEELLNLLWLASPMVKSLVSTEEISSVGLSRLVSATLDDSLPSASTIRRLDENIQKYAQGNVSDYDIIRVSKSIAARTIAKSLESLNEEAAKDPAKFVQSLNDISKKEKQKEEQITASIKRLFRNVDRKTAYLNTEITKIEKERESFQQVHQAHDNKHEQLVEMNSTLTEENRRIKKMLLDKENDDRKTKRKAYIRKEIYKWRWRAARWVILLLLLAALFILSLLIIKNWDTSATWSYLKETLLFSIMFYLYGLGLGILVALLVPRYNASTVNAFKSNIEIPDELREK